MSGKIKLRSLFEKRLLLKPWKLNIWYAYFFFEIKNNLFINATKIMTRLLPKLNSSKIFMSLLSFRKTIITILGTGWKIKKFKKKIKPDLQKKVNLENFKKKIWKYFFGMPKIHTLIFRIQVDLIFGKLENILLLLDAVRIKKLINNFKLLKKLKYIHQILGEGIKFFFLFKDLFILCFCIRKKKKQIIILFPYINFLFSKKIIGVEYLNPKFLTIVWLKDQPDFKKKKQKSIFDQFLINFLIFSGVDFFYFVSRIFLFFFFREKIEKYNHNDKKKNAHFFEIFFDFLNDFLFFDPVKPSKKNSCMYEYISSMILVGYNLILDQKFLLHYKKFERRKINKKNKILNFFCFL